MIDGAALLAWAETSPRDLPWRRTRDPWSVLVSEVMLQQTQVARVVPRYQAFLARFPTTVACAASPVGDVVRAWAGLGYNSRAVRLHGAARAVEAEHGGRFPATLDGLRSLPGVGPYTARAVLAFAYEIDAAVVDVNVARVMARLAGRRLRPGEVQALADDALPAGRSWVWNQAMLDLGATVCVARRPRCAECPVSASCAWRGEGDDPATGSAGVGGRQSVFVGSDRQGRGRLVHALRSGPVALSEVATVTGWTNDPARAARIVTTLVTDGLAVERDGHLYLP